MQPEAVDNRGLRRRRELAVLTVVILLLAGGVGFRELDRYLAEPTDTAPLPPGALARLPLRIGTWLGRDVPLDEEVRRATDTDDLINRQYTREGGGDTVGFYVACGVKARDLMPHRPEVCYPAAGWTADGGARLRLPLPDGTALDSRILRFAQGGFDLRKIIVLNYYIVDGAYWPDVSLLRSRAWRGARGVGRIVQVQVTCVANAFRSVSAAEDAAKAFACASAAAVRSVLAGADSDGQGGKAAAEQGGAP